MYRTVCISRGGAGHVIQDSGRLRTVSMVAYHSPQRQEHAACVRSFALADAAGMRLACNLTTANLASAGKGVAQQGCVGGA